MRKKTQLPFFRSLLSLVFIFFGIIALGKNFNFWVIDDLFLQWWPVVLIILGFLILFTTRSFRGRGILMVILGLVLVLHTNKILDLEKLLGPAMLILLGLILWPRKIIPPKTKTRGKKETIESESLSKAEVLKEEAVEEEPVEEEPIEENHVHHIRSLFRRKEKSIDDKLLEALRASVVFGKLNLDLRNAAPDTAANIVLNAAFAKLSIFLPSNWNVDLKDSAFLGKINDKRKIVPDAVFIHSVTLDCKVILAEIEILNENP